MELEIFLNTLKFGTIKKNTTSLNYKTIEEFNNQKSIHKNVA